MSLTVCCLISNSYGLLIEITSKLAILLYSYLMTCKSIINGSALIFEDMDYYVYGHISKLTGLYFYVGKGKGRRAFSSASRNKYWRNIANKEGYIVDLLAVNLSEDKALALEIEKIAELKPRANLSSGGRGGCTGIKRSVDDLDRRIATQKRQRVCPEWKKMNSEIQKEVQNRPEVIAKRSAGKKAFLDKVKNGEFPNPFKGMQWTPEQIENISSKQRGEKGFWYGKTTSVAKKVINVNTGQVFQSLKEAAESVNGNFRSLSRSIRKNRKFKNNHFEFYKDNK